MASRISLSRHHATLMRREDHATTIDSKAVFGSLSPTWVEGACCLLALLLFGIANDYGAVTLLVANTIGPAIFSLGLFYGMYHLVSRSINNLWAPLLWYRVAMFVYFGMGALVPIYANGDTRDLITQFYLFFPQDILKLNVVIISFHVIFLIFSRMILGLAASSAQNKSGISQRLDQSIVPSKLGLGVFGAVLLIVGTLVNVFAVLPVTLGLYEVPGFGTIYNLSLASLLGYFLLTLWALRNRSLWLIVVLLVASLESALGLLQMSKFIALFPFVMVGMGFVFHRPTLARFGMFGGTILLLFTTLAPIVGHVRNSAQEFHAGAATPIEVMRLYGSYDSKYAAQGQYGDVQNGWIRLSYVNQGTFAINQYDRGVAGDTYKYIFIIWIPRLLYPSKPNITDISREFTFAINGNYNSSTSPGIPAEAYYNLGWAGVVAVALFMSATMTLWSLYSFYALERHAWHLFFVVLIGMRTASRLDGALTADVVGPIGLAVLAHIALQFLNKFPPDSNDRSRASAVYRTLRGRMGAA